HLMYLVLADNAIARRKAQGNTVPKLRACFHIGSCYEFHQAEGLNPTLYHYIVGDVTIELARMIDRALPHQILLGDFRSEHRRPDGEPAQLDAMDFVVLASQSVRRLEGLELSGERIETIKTYLTGTRQADGALTVRRNAEPILLGIEDRLIASLEVLNNRSEHLAARRLPETV